MKKLHLAWDILALASFERLGKLNGHHRSNLNMLEALSKRDDVKVSCFVSQGIYNLEPAKRCLKKHQLNLPFKHNAVKRWLSKVMECLCPGCSDQEGHWIHKIPSVTLSDLKGVDVAIIANGLHPLPAVFNQAGAPPYLYWIHDLLCFTHESILDPAFAKARQRVYRGLDTDAYYLTMSETVKAQMQEILGFDLQKIYTVKHAADPKLLAQESPSFDSLSQKYLLKKQPYLLSVSDICPHKNQACSLEAFFTLHRNKRLPELFKDLHYVLVGELGNSDYFNFVCKKLIQTEEDLEISKKLILTGQVPDSELKALYENCTAFVFPSLSEGFGLPILEAMHFSAPCLLSNDAVIVELFGQNIATTETALFFNPKDPQDLAQLISHCLQDPQKLKNLQKASKLHALSFSWEKSSTQLLKAIHQRLES